MDDNSRIRKQRITALTLATTLFLGGCSAKNSSFNLVENENDEIVAMEDSYIEKGYIDNYYVVEMYNNVLKKSELYIAKYSGWTGEYTDVFTNAKLYYGTGELLEFVNSTGLEEYIVALGMVQFEYSYDDMKNIYEAIKENYVFERDNDNSLRRIRSNNNRI